MAPLKNYKLPDGTTRQYREGEQPECAVAVATAAGKQTPETRAKAAAKRSSAKKEA